MLGGHKIRLKIQNPHVPLNKLTQMNKEDLLAAIHNEYILEAGMKLQRKTLVDILNYQLNHDPDAEVKP